MRRFVLGSMLALAGCGPAAAPAAVSAVDEAAGPSFRTNTSFGHLAERIAALPGGDGLGCLLDARGAAFRFVGEPAPAISPMPGVDDGAFEAARAAPSIRLLSRWGVDGDAGPFVASFTHHPPASTAGAFIVLVRTSGASVRGTAARAPRLDGLSPGALLDALRREEVPPVVVFVGETGLPLATLIPYLEVADAASSGVALGIALPPQVEVPPERSEPASSTEGRCDALPTLLGDEPVGRIDPAVGRASFASMSEAVEDCATSSASRRVALGGRMRLAIRIDGDGRATDACMLEDEVDDEGFRRCLLAAARAHAWPRPTPRGYVDVNVRLVLAPDARSRQRGLCPPSASTR